MKRNNKILDNERFIQLYIGNEPIIRYAESSNDNHSNILERALKDELDIQFNKVKLNAGIVPEPKGKEYELSGAGNAGDMGEYIFLYGESTHYNIKPNKEHASKYNLTNPEKILMIGK